ncbi:MAG: hypothetical protein AAGG81_05905 [Chlamydiota bacterium]
MAFFKNYLVFKGGENAFDCAIRLACGACLGSFICAEDVIENVQDGKVGTAASEVFGSLAFLAGGITSLVYYPPGQCYDDLMDYYEDQDVAHISAGMASVGLTSLYVVTTTLVAIPIGGLAGKGVALAAEKVTDACCGLFSRKSLSDEEKRLITTEYIQA